VLGYVHLLAGRREAAEELWRRAAACDPDNTLARVLFEGAPQKIPEGVQSYGTATLPEFDEAAWKARLAAAAAKPAPAAEVPVTPGVAPAREAPSAAKPAAAVAAPAAEPTGISWLDALATGEGEVKEQEGELVPGVAPFDLEGLDLTGVPAAAPAPLPTPEKEPSHRPAEKPAVPVAEAPVAAEAPAPSGAQAPEMRPFALEDLGLSPEEIASLEEAVASTRSGEGAQAPEGVAFEEEATLGLQPFSLEEEGGLGGEEAGVAGVAPFSLEEATAPGAAEEAAPPGVAPFSLEQAAAAAAKGEAGVSGVVPFSLEEATAPGGAELPDIAGLEPFSVESLGLEAVAGGAGVPPEMAGGLKPFSLEELGLEEATGEPEPAGMERFREGMGEEVDTGLPAFSWQEAGTSKAPAFRGQLGPQEQEAAASGPSLFEKMMATRRGPSEPGAEVPEAPPAEAPVEEGVEPFSLEGLGLQEVPATGVQEAVSEEEGVPGLQPFSVEAFGLAEAAPAEMAGEALQPFSLEELGLEEAAPAAPEEGMAPFTLEELGLAEAAPPAVVEEGVSEGLPEMEPFSLEELGEVPGELAVPSEPAAVAAPAEDVLRPFSLEELGLTTEEITAMGLGQEQEAAPAEVLAAAIEELPPALEEAVPAPAEVPPELEAVAPAEAEELAAVPPAEAAAVAPPVSPLEELRAQVAAQPEDEKLLLALARVCEGEGQYEEAFGHYRKLIKAGKASVEDALLGDLRDWIEQEQDHKRLYRLHRLLGDAYMKRGWYQQAISEYAWVLSKQ
jgi:tetratricopeptide (TPR) repeat protein